MRDRLSGLCNDFSIDNILKTVNNRDIHVVILED